MRTEEPDYNIMAGKTFKNKDEVIDALLMEISCISGDQVEVQKPTRPMTLDQINRRLKQLGA